MSNIQQNLKFKYYIFFTHIKSITIETEINKLILRMSPSLAKDRNRGKKLCLYVWS